MRVSRSILWLALLAATPVLAQQDLSKISGDVHAATGQKYGALATVSGDIQVDAGVEAKSVNSVSGDVTVEAGARIDEGTTVSGDLKIGENSKTGDLTTVSGNLTVGRNAVIDGSVTSVSGSIFVDRGGKIDGDVTSVSGGIGLVQTEVKGDITFVSSDVTVGVGSHVKGRLQLKKPKGVFTSKRSQLPRVVIGPNAVIDGPLAFELPVKLYVHSTAKTGAITGATAVSFDTPAAPKN
ncbi:MAG: hypothetical protein ABW178_06485 [Pseudoxanthomonas sp.]